MIIHLVYSVMSFSGLIGSFLYPAIFEELLDSDSLVTTSEKKGLMIMLLGVHLYCFLAQFIDMELDDA